MSQQVLQMKYHPAKKEVAFVRVCSGKEIPITGGSGSVLSKYINKKGQFVLQDHGNQLFSDIVDAFDGEEEVNLAVTMTKNDYEDFIQMVDYFNKNSEIKINPTLLAELPDMKATYEVVKKHGLDSIEILNRNRDDFHNVKSDNENVLLCIENFAKEINEATKGIREKIDTLDQNSVNVCFSGPYSSGKSLLIDSLIGYEILPTDIRPETAAMFTIRSPKSDEKVRINFNMIDSETSFAEVMWNELTNAFEFVAGQAECETRKYIQKVINECKGEEQYIQVRNILNALNENSYVERVINVYFPIAMDNEHVQFTIYDTPGTDSGVAAHRSILKDALSEQTHSILVFVTYPNGLSGGGNKALLEYLSEIDSKENKSTIDIGRSLFVINYADTLTDDDAFESIRTGKISNKKDIDEGAQDDKKYITIKLADKKVLFTTAKYGYLATAKRNSIITKSDEKLFKLKYGTMLDDEFGLYYRHDRCASSEFATKQLYDKCTNALQSAKESGDLAQQMWIATGMYALENEIQEYGEKYASAVKTYSIIDGVDKALSKLDRNARSIERQNSNNIAEVEKEISTIRTAISEGIANAKKGRELGQNQPLPNEVLTQLHLNAEAISSYVIAPAKENVDKYLLTRLQKAFEKIFYRSPKETAWNEENEPYIEQAIRDVLNDYTNHFVESRKTLLENLRDDFINDVKESIRKNGDMSEEAKKYITDIDAPDVDEFDGINEFRELYRKQKRIKKGWFFEKQYLDREAFFSDLNKKLRSITRDLADSYTENYRNTLNGLLRKVESEFNQNMDRYSVSLKAKLDDKDAMEDLKKRILNAANELHHCQSVLNEKIWEVNKL